MAITSFFLNYIPESSNSNFVLVEDLTEKSPFFTEMNSNMITNNKRKVDISPPKRDDFPSLPLK